MGRIPCCEKDNVKRGQWTPEEDHKLTSYIAQHGTRNWRLIPKHAGLQRCGKSCRLRWTNYLRPDLKHGQFSDAEEQTIVTLHSVLGNRYFHPYDSQIPKNQSHSHIGLIALFSFDKTDGLLLLLSCLITEIATTLAPPQVPHLAEAALGCFKDEMLHLLTKKRMGFQMQQLGITPVSNPTATHVKHEDKDETIEKIKYGLSRAIKDPNTSHTNKPWDQSGGASRSFGGTCNAFSASVSGFHYGLPSLVNEGDGSPWNQSMCAGSSTAGEHQGRLDEKLEDENCEDSEGGNQTRDGSNIFSSDCVLWDLPSEDLMNPIV